MAGMTRGRLPARVYWVRRLMVLGVAVLLVVGIARLLGGSSDGSSGTDRAATVADTADATATPSTNGPVTSPKQHRHVSAAPVTRVAMPSGPCAPDDIAMTPSVPKP